MKNFFAFTKGDIILIVLLVATLAVSSGYYCGTQLKMGLKLSQANSP